MLPGSKEALSHKFSQEGNHLLDLIHQCYLPTYAKVQSKKAISPAEITSARSFQKRNRIKFMRFRAKSLLDIHFEDGILEIAPMRTHKFTEILFANLIALEQFHTEIQYFRSYALLMAGFMKSEKDAEFFRRLGIFILDEGQKDEDIFNLFVRLCENVDVKEFYYSGLLEQIEEYRRRRKSWKQAFKCTCFRTSTPT
ncbi:hypothetical protein L6164_013658 [Bauhinia variegata]|nr:hypothetical protein L6164_013658 [Bauhinia variegata]